MSGLRVVEGSSGTWFYHLATGSDFTSLCGKQTMACALPMSAWGTVTHLKERYCKECEKRRPASPSAKESTDENGK